MCKEKRMNAAFCRSAERRAVVSRTVAVRFVLLVPSWEKLPNTKVISSVCDCNLENCFLRDRIRSLLAGFPGSQSEPLHLSSVSVSSISSVIHQLISVQLKCHRGPSPHSCWANNSHRNLVFCFYFCFLLSKNADFSSFKPSGEIKTKTCRKSLESYISCAFSCSLDGSSSLISSTLTFNRAEDFGIVSGTEMGSNTLLVTRYCSSTARYSSNE